MHINEVWSLLRINCATTGEESNLQAFAIIASVRSREEIVHYLELLDWRRRVARLFADLRLKPPTSQTAEWFRSEKDALFQAHPQSPILPGERSSFQGLHYWPHDPDARVLARLEAVPSEAPGQEHASGEATLDLIGTLSFDLAGHSCSLGAFWIRGYAGGLFVPFRDRSSGTESYGGGRYLLDTIKGADLGEGEGGTVVLDFNYAYNPSCAYDPQWACPLAPPSNRLDFPVLAGERMWTHVESPA